MGKKEAVKEPETAEAKGGEFHFLKLDELIPTPQNNRRFRENEAFAELVRSVAALGVLQPILVRPIMAAGGMYEIRAGERRWRAAKAAGLKTIPAVVRDMCDRTALEVTITENSQREDLTPLEEAAGVNMLLGGGWTADQAATQLGKSRGWVLRRGALGRLVPEWVKEYEEGQARTWSTAHLELVARLPEKQQVELLKMLREDYRYGRGFAELNAKDLKRVSEQRFLRRLSAATWDLNDAELFAKAGACASCEKRSGCNPDLFDELQGKPGVCRECNMTLADYKSEAKALKLRTVEWPRLDLCPDCSEDDDPKRNDTKDSCLDPACWSQKSQAFMQRSVDAARMQHGRDVAIVNGYDGGRGELKALGTTVVREYDFTISDKPTKGSAPAIVGPDIGEDKYKVGSIVYLTPRNEGSQAAKKVKGQTLAEKRAELEKFRGRDLCDEVKKAVLGLAEPRTKADAPLPLSLAQIVALAAVFGTDMRTHGRDDTEWSEYSAHLNQDGLVDVERTGWELLRNVLPVLADRLGWYDEPPLEEAQTICRLLKWNYHVFWQEAIAARPEPKSWKKLEEEELTKKVVKDRKKAVEPTKKKGQAKGKAGLKAAGA